MPHSSLIISGGVDTNLTPTLNQAGLSQSNLIRYMSDPSGKPLVQKIGGWTKYYSSVTASEVLSLCAWEDLNQENWLAVGAVNELKVLDCGSISNPTNPSNPPVPSVIAPRQFSNNFTPNFSTTINSNVVTIINTGSGQSSYNFVNFITPIAVVGSGITLSGVYPIAYQNDVNTYAVYASTLATATVNNVGKTYYATTTSGSYAVSINFANHGLAVGNIIYINPSFPITIGGVTLSGTYTVFSITDVNNFVVNVANVASSNASAYQNSNMVNAVYYVGIGPNSLSGYGGNLYSPSGSLYGYGVSSTINIGTAITGFTDWSLDNWGQILIANPANGPIYYWQPNSYIQNAQILSAQVPLINDGIFVAMPQRQIVAWGSTVTQTQDPLLVRWCDVQDFTTWIASSTNQAGSFRIPRGSRIVGGLQVAQQGLLWTDLGVWSMQYIGQPYIYSFNEIGTGCGLISRKAAGTNNGMVYWMSQSQFFMMGGSVGVTAIPCPVWDVVFQNIDTSNLNSIRCAVNSRFNEVSWFYPTVGSNGLNTNYVKYNYLLNMWDYGTLGRTAWINQSILGAPIAAGTDNYIYQHEFYNGNTLTDADGAAINASFETGYFALNEGDVKTFIDQVWPDMKWQTYNGLNSTGGASVSAAVQITFYVADYPTDTPTIYGPYTVYGPNPPSGQTTTQYITPRFRGRLVAISLSSADTGTWWRVGNFRYRFQQDGKF